MLVFLLVNEVNYKAYVGQTSRTNLERRWNNKFNNSTLNPHFASAVTKYGPEAFSRQILNQCSSRQETDNLERLWIALLRTHDPRYGYNIQLGGIKATHTAESRRKISEARKLRWQQMTKAEKRTSSREVSSSVEEQDAI